MVRTGQMAAGSQTGSRNPEEVSFLPEKGVVSSRRAMRRHSTSFNIIEHHMLMFHTHSLRCCIHTSYGPTCRIYEHIRRHSTHMSHIHIIIHHSLTVSYGRHLLHVSFITHTTSYNIIHNIHEMRMDGCRHTNRKKHFASS